VNKIYILIVLLLVLNQNLFAACERDRFGEVYCGLGKCAQDKEGHIFCSKYLHGDAINDKYGNVVCGKGQCLPSTDFNESFCSVIEGGGASSDREGHIKCYGGCEKASPTMCEQVKGK
jgi:hypothetical protein